MKKRPYIIPIIGSALAMAILDRLSKSPCLTCPKKKPWIKYPIPIDPCQLCEVRKRRINRYGNNNN